MLCLFCSCNFFRMLFIIVGVFLLCNVPRLTLNTVEFVSVMPWYYSNYFGQESAAEKSSCLQMPAWTYVLSHISSFLMTLNASLGFVIYCTTSSAFQDELKKLMKSVLVFRRGRLDE